MHAVSWILSHFVTILVLDVLSRGRGILILGWERGAAKLYEGGLIGLGRAARRRLGGLDGRTGLRGWPLLGGCSRSARRRGGSPLRRMPEGGFRRGHFVY